MTETNALGIPVGWKACRGGCDMFLPLSGFRDYSTHKVCLDCEPKAKVKETRLIESDRYIRGLQRAYGVSPEQYRAMVARSGYLCEICRQPPETGKRLHIDHNHLTGEVRGLLCSPCNMGLGQFEDDTTKLRAAIAYLEQT